MIECHDLLFQRGVLLCRSRKNPYPSHGRSSEIPRGRGVLKVKILKAKYEAKLEFPGGMRGEKRITFRGGIMDIFGTANCTFTVRSYIWFVSCTSWIPASLTFFDIHVGEVTYLTIPLT